MEIYATFKKEFASTKREIIKHFATTSLLLRIFFFLSSRAKEVRYSSNTKTRDHRSPNFVYTLQSWCFGLADAHTNNTCSNYALQNMHTRHVFL